MASGHHYIALAQTAQKTASNILLLGNVAIGADRTENTVPVTCAIVVVLMSYLLCSNLIMALSLVMSQYVRTKFHENLYRS
jgi:hypothetical protein